MAQRFPEDPTTDEREAFESFVFLLSRLYPCGEWYGTCLILCNDHNAVTQCARVPAASRKVPATNLVSHYSGDLAMFYSQPSTLFATRFLIV
jgi:hypothetical protein